MYSLILIVSASPREEGEVRHDLKPLADPLHKLFYYLHRKKKKTYEIEICLTTLNFISYLTAVLIKWPEVEYIKINIINYMNL